MERGKQGGERKAGWREESGVEKGEQDGKRRVGWRGESRMKRVGWRAGWRGEQGGDQGWRGDGEEAEESNKKIQQAYYL